MKRRYVMRRSGLHELVRLSDGKSSYYDVAECDIHCGRPGEKWLPQSEIAFFLGISGAKRVPKVHVWICRKCPHYQGSKDMKKAIRRVQKQRRRFW